MHVIDAIMRCSFELDEKRKKKNPHRRTQAFLSFQNNYSPHAYSLLPLLRGDPRPDAEMDVVFGFLSKVVSKFSDGLHIKIP